jgi:hypothetical protein
MKTDNQVTDVIFRKFKDGDIIALFPYEIDNYHGDCLSYMHIGQHGGANYWHCLTITKPAMINEYEPLMRELISIGYELRIRQKINYKVFLSAMKIFRDKYN